MSPSTVPSTEQGIELREQMSGSGFFNHFSPWGGWEGSRGQQGGGPRGPGRGGAHPDRRPLGQGGPRGHILFGDEAGYDFADDGREFAGRSYTLCRGLSDLEYEARQNAIFQPEGAPPARKPNVGGHPAGGRGDGQPALTPAWTGQQGSGRLTPPGPPYDPHGQQGSGTPNPPDVQVHQAPDLQLGRAQIAMQPPGGQGGAGAGLPQPTAGVINNGTPPNKYSAIASALKRLAPVMTDADTVKSLRWQQEVKGDANRLASWKIEATAVPGLQFYAYLQPGEAFLVVGHTMSTLYSTTTDVATHHGKEVLFTRDRTGTRECVPVILPPNLAFAWKKCMVVDDKTRLREWYANQGSSEYGNLWDPTPQDGTREEINVLPMIALPLCAAKLYHQFTGPVMPHELLAAVEDHLASSETSFGNGNDWGLVQKWLMVAAQ